MKTRGALQLVLVTVIASLAIPSLASATWPGQNGKIYFVCREEGTLVGARDICSMNPDGSDRVNLTNTPDVAEGQPQVSIDGRQVTFAAPGESGNVAWVMNADGSNLRAVNTVVTDGPSWTPDGKIAYRAKPTESTYEYQVVTPDGGTPQKLSNTAVFGTSSPPRFNAQGSWLFGRFVPIPGEELSQTEQIFVVEGDSESQVTFGAIGLTSNVQPTWSPDGNRIVYWAVTAGKQDIWSVSAGGGTPVKVTTTDAVQEGWPSLSPDGDKLIYELQDAEHDFFHKAIGIANADGSNPTIVPTSGLIAASNPVWAPEPTDGPVPKAAFTATGPKSVKKGKPAKVTLRCSGDTRCAVTYGVTVTVPRKGKKAKSFKVKAKSLTMNAKTNKVVNIKPPAAANGLIAKALKARKTPSIKVTATARQPGGPQIRKVNLRITVKK
ncbi:MAG: TolB protein [Actinomycetota bacterium]|jgi:hypothetical protein|nr:TolB protein [Actinomycetota bacterium]